MGGPPTMDTETQCQAMQCSTPAKFIEEKNQNKTWTVLMLWHPDQYRKAKQGASIPEPLFRQPIELSQTAGQAPQAMKYLRQKLFQKYATSLYPPLNPTA